MRRKTIAAPIRLYSGLLALSTLGAAPLAGAQDVVDEIVVTADFRQRAALDVAASVTVLDAATIGDAGVQHFEELVPLIPNLHWSGGSSRPRYFQIRGIGERSQYEGAPNPSVGFLIDDIDFSGIGMVSTLFDVSRVEVLRGSQGTRYGANALAGLINVRSRDPGDEFTVFAEATGGDDDARAAGLAFGGPIGNGARAPAYRLAVHQFQSDGFRDNAYLGRSDTNNRDETLVRGKLRLYAGDTVQVDVTGMHADLDNGYDAFAIDNSLTTQSDKPGKDSQASDAGALRITWSGANAFELVSITTAASSDIEHSFDGDWGNDDLWAQVVDYDYDFTSRTLRERDTWSQEFRLVSTPDGALFGGRSDWVAGVFTQSLDESNDILDLFNDEVFRDLVSDYEATNTAVFGELDTALTDRTSLTTGLRVEHRDARYSDSTGAAFSPSETMVGGQVALVHRRDEDTSLFAGLSRGYKAGGFNIDLSIPPERREFGAEYLWSLEAGVRQRWFDGRLSANLTLFHSWRDNQQVDTSFQDDPGDPLSFTFFTDNAAEGRSYGLEADATWQLSPQWRVFGTLGLLETRFDEFIAGDRDLSGREQAHAPGYQASVGAEWNSPGGWFARVDALAVDSFYYSDGHDQQSDSYALVNARAGFQAESWSVQLWGRNVFDERYTVRGFFFGNEPPDFEDTLYVRLGDPSNFGATLRFFF
ncbi:MAG: TonB-dependent receptor [Pseudomonadota bacterium]